MKEGSLLSNCPVKKALDVLGGKWKMLIINQIGMEIRRYGELKRMIPGISEKMLIQELKSLVEYGVLEKKSYAEIPPRVEYKLTEKGRKVIPLIEEMRIIGREFVEPEK